MRNAVLLSLFLAVGCTPQQQAHTRTALDVNQCANAVVLRHLDAEDDFKDPVVIAVIAGEIASECIPRSGS